MRDWVILRSSDLAEMELMTIRILSAIVCAVIVCIQSGQAFSPTHPFTFGKIQGPKYIKQKPESQLTSRSSKPELKQIYEITAYTAGQESTGKESGSSGYGLTASGEQIQKGDCAADDSIPFGTRVFIDGLGVFRVVDRGGSVHQGHIDIYIPDLQEAIKFGRQYREVTLIPVS